MNVSRVLFPSLAWGRAGSKPFLVPSGEWSPRLRVGSLSSQNSADPVRADARLKTRPSAGNRAGSVGPHSSCLEYSLICMTLSEKRQHESIHEARYTES